MGDQGAQRWTPQEWRGLTADVLARQPELASATVEGMQAGLLAAIEHQQERVVQVSLALVEALDTRPGAVRRRGERIVRGIKASTFHPTPWSREMIAKEGGDDDGE